MPKPMGHVGTSAKSFLPAPLVRWLRGRRNAEARLMEMWQYDAALGRTLHKHTAGKVIAGPFTGLDYVDTALGSNIAPKLIGTYELELHAIVEQIVATPYSTFVDIGAGEGYYVVGLAQRMPGLHVVAFEAEERNQPLIEKLAALNHVRERVRIESLCTPQALRQRLEAEGSAAGRVLILCDIEGAEIDVLDFEQVPQLLEADVLVELHDVPEQPVSAPIRRRFEATHEIQEIWTRPRELSDWPANWPASAPLSNGVKRDCMNERRDGPMNWFWMRRIS